MKDYDATVDEYVLKERLGAGAYSEVRVCQKKDGTRCAIKYHLLKTLPAHHDCLELVNNEVKALSRLSHPHVLKLHQYSNAGCMTRASGEKVPIQYLVLDLLEGGSLHDFISITGKLPEELARYYFRQLAETVAFVHGKGFAHRDIKVGNILLDRNYSSIVLCDFGFAAPTKEGSKVLLHDCKGTLEAMAPEIYSGAGYDGEKVDIFALGVVLFVMVAGFFPFKEATRRDDNYRMFCQHNAAFWGKVSAMGAISSELKGIINGLLTPNPEKRITMSKIRKHPWYNGPAISPDELCEELKTRQAKMECFAELQTCGSVFR